MPDAITIAIILVLLVLIGLVLANQIARVTIYEYQVGLLYRNGRFERKLGPGVHVVFRPSTHIKTLDTRTSATTVQGQELITSDGITVKMTLAVQLRVADAVAATHAVDNYSLAVYTAIQVALRETVGAMSIDDVLGRRGDIGAEVLRLSMEPAAAVGVELVSVDLKDLMLPPASKKLFNQVVEARQRGLAALEKARGETAALRSLANAARMVESNPSLLQLRLLQQLESTSGNTVLLGMPPSTTPLPVRQVEPTAERGGATTAGQSSGPGDPE